MKFLRTVSTRRLMATIAGLIVAIAAGTAIAAAGTQSVPAPKPLARAIHGALGGPSVTGITADITFTNHLIDSADFTGGPADPILQGATGRLWLSNDHRMRLELQSNNGDAQVVVNQRSFWISDPALHTVYQGTLPADTAKAVKAAKAAKAVKAHKSAAPGVPTVAQIQTDLNKLMRQINVVGPAPGNVANQPAYTVRISPKHDGGLLGSATLVFDALRGVPLEVGVYASGNDTSPVLELKATNISYGPVSNSDLAVTPPIGSKVVKIATAGPRPRAHGTTHAGRKGKHAEASGVSAVARHLPFGFAPPTSLVGLPRHHVSLLDWGGKPAALVTYGENLGGVVVIEQAAPAPDKTKTKTTGSGRSDTGTGGLSLPAVSINGSTGQELATPLGTVLRFTRKGIAYTVLGSVPAPAANRAAVALAP